MAVIAVCIAAGAVGVLAGGLAQNFGPTMLADLEIYRGAIVAAWAGQSLYDWTYTGHPIVSGLGFTYPPFAAVALGWVTWWDLATVKVIWTAGAMVVAVAAVWLLVHTSSAGTSRTLPVQLTWAAALAVALLFSYPVLHDLFIGQASIFVVALVLFDHTLPRRWQGALIGVAAAIKLTPLVFVAYFLVSRQWRAAVVSAGTFAAASLLAAALLPRDSLDYWTQRVWQTGRIGEPAVAINKSLLGLVSRMLGTGPATTLIWIVMAVAVAVLAFWQAKRCRRSGDALGATLMVGVLSVAVSPISWPHHLVWLSLVACWWLLQQRRGFAIAGVLLFVVLMIYPAYFMPAPEFTPLPGLGEVPTLAVLAVLVIGSGRRSPEPAAEVARA